MLFETLDSMNTNTIRIAAVTAALLALAAFATAAPTNSTVDPVNASLTEAGFDLNQMHAVAIDGIVILRGYVPSTSDFNRAAEVVKANGYQRVANLLRVQPTTNDKALERSVERALGTSRVLEGCQLTVHSINGAVTVRGTVKYDVQRDAAGAIVRNVQGVKSVAVLLDRS